MINTVVINARLTDIIPWSEIKSHSIFDWKCVPSVGGTSIQNCGYLPMKFLLRSPHVSAHQTCCHFGKLTCVGTLVYICRRVGDGDVRKGLG